MSKKSLTKRVKSRASNKAETKAEINLLGGEYDGKSICIAFPSPRFLVLSMGKELYVREDDDRVVEATYRYTDDWSEYQAFLDERKHIY